MSKRRAVFFDRDGPLNDLIDRGPNFELGGKKVALTAPWHMSELRINPHAKSVIDTVRARGYLVIMATNQPDVVYGALTEETFQEIHREVVALGFDDVWACRHGRDEECGCRKPRPGLLLGAAKKWNIDMQRSFFVGDMETDMQAAQSAGCMGVLLHTSYNGHASGSYVIRDLAELLKWV